MSESYVVEESPRVWFSMLPNMICEIGLSPHEIALYVHLKRIAQDNGGCWASTKSLAEKAGMSVGMISKTKNSLVERGLIKIAEVTEETEVNGITLQPKRGGRAPHLITIVDIWKANAEHYQSSCGELASSCGELKKIEIKKKEEGADAPPPEDAIESEETQEAEHTQENKRTRTEQDDYFDAVAWVLYRAETPEQVKLLSKGAKANTGRTAKKLREHGVGLSDLKAWWKWWRANDWRGKQGERPTPSQLTDNWSAFEEWRKGNNGNVETDKYAGWEVFM